MKRIATFGLLVVLAFGLPLRAAYAIPTNLQLSDGLGDYVWVSDSAASVIVGAASITTLTTTPAGFISMQAQVGAWIINVTTGVAPTITGPSLNPAMDLNSADNSTAAGTLTIMFGAQNLSATPGYNILAGIGGTTKGTLLAQDYYDPANGLFAPGGAVTGTAVVTMGAFGPGAFSGVGSSGPLGADPFSLTKVVTITHPAGGFVTSSFDFGNETVPEPASILLLGSGLAGFGYLRRRNRGKASTK